MQSIILTGVLDYDPRLAICHSASELRAALADWFGELVPDLDFAAAGPQAIEDAVAEAMAPSDWTALVCFPLIDDGLAFTGEALTVGAALARYDEIGREDDGATQTAPKAA